MISITELLGEIGVDNVRVQYLTQDLHGNQRLVGPNLKISFLSDPTNLDLKDLALRRPTKREGIICWVDRAAMEAAFARLRSRATGDPINLEARHGSPAALANAADYERAHGRAPKEGAQ